MDINPALCNKIVGLGGVTCLCKKLENIHSFDLIEHVIKALEKISYENPYAILIANGFASLTKLMEFFDYQMQVSSLFLIL